MPLSLTPWRAGSALIMGLAVFSWSSHIAAQSEPSPNISPATHTVLLTASPEHAPPFAGAVVVVGRLPGNRHLGVIVNRPSQITLHEILPDDFPAKRPEQTVRLGGPVYANELFAIVRAAAPPNSSVLALSADLFLVGDALAVDELIRHDAPEVRYFVGLVAWDSGQLQTEVERGLWSFNAIESADLFHVMTDNLGDSEDRQTDELEDRAPVEDVPNLPFASHPKASSPIADPMLRASAGSYRARPIAPHQRPWHALNRARRVQSVRVRTAH